MNSPEVPSSSLPAPSVQRRRHERRPLHSSVRIIYCSDATQRVQIAQGIDVGDSGVAFEIDSALDFYSMLRLEYTEDDGTKYCRTAILQYRMQRRYGAWFVETEQELLPQ
jgi:hypothetical protein